MASIGGLSGTTSNNINGIRGYGGLASGLDRDSLIEGMTYATRSKIDQFQGKKTKLQWKQDAIRNISDKMIAFAEKYTATLASTSNLFSGALWGRSQITMMGANSKFLSVTGSANSASQISIAGVKQLAKKASWSSDAMVSDGVLETGVIDPSEEKAVDNLAGKTISFNYDGKDYTVTLSGKDEQGNPLRFDAEHLQESLKKVFDNQKIGDGEQNLLDILDVTKDGGIVGFTNKDTDKEIKITGGSAMELLGFEKDKEQTIGANSEVKATNAVTDDTLVKKLSFVDQIAGKEISFNYNGTLKSFRLPSKDGLDGLSDDEVMKKIRDSLQSQMNASFGNERVSVELVDGKGNLIDKNNSGDRTYKLNFRTTKPGGGEDNSASLTMINGDSGVVGKDGALKVAYGESNRLNLNAKLGEAGFNNFELSGKASFTLNGTEIEITENDTVYTLMEKINKNTDVTVKYQEVGDKFIFTSNQEGRSGKIEFGAAPERDADGNIVPDTENKGLEAIQKIFGSVPTKDTKEVRGEDAVISVKYGDSGEAVEITRGSNSFTVDGMTITVKGTFGYGQDGKLVDDPAEAVSFNAEVDTTKVMDNIKKMVEEYNSILELVNKEAKTRPDREYHPLTADEKKELDKDEAKLYEDKAKEGILYGDTDIRALANDLRFAINPVDLAEMEKIGLTVSNSYADNGKLVLDETKFKAALDSDPSKVEKLFTKENGIASNMKNVMNKYANTLGEKGILINKAGSEKAPRSITENKIYGELKDMDKKIAQFQGRLKVEHNRYIKQFTSLESLISQMNAQSGFLSQFGGGY